MVNALNVRYRDGNRIKNALKSKRPATVKKVSLETKRKGSNVKRVVATTLLTPAALSRVKVLPDVKDAILKVLESGSASKESKEIIVSKHQLRALRSNPNANTSLTKKQMKKLKSRALACGLLEKSTAMEF
jgi:hypothetical protein